MPRASREQIGFDLGRSEVGKREKASEMIIDTQLKLWWIKVRKMGQLNPTFPSTYTKLKTVKRTFNDQE